MHAQIAGGFDIALAGFGEHGENRDHGIEQGGQPPRRLGEGHAVMLHRPFHIDSMKMLDAEKLDGAARLVNDGDLGDAGDAEHGAQNLGGRPFACEQQDADVRKSFQLHEHPPARMAHFRHFALIRGKTACHIFRTWPCAS